MAFPKTSAVTTVVVVVVVVVVMVATRVAEGQSTPSCAQKLVPCANYINSTNPPASCCDPLREAVTQDRECLCNLYNTPGLLASLGINVTQALLLPGHCNVPGNTSACTKATTPPTSSSVPATATTSTVPAPPSNGAKVASMGTSSLLLFCASMMLY
ncbi:non-specific lipid transfer protein GPI-anchored 7-like [Cornus florida]|uniref:non-specific lipid transfer protein GPI-anchored 7-like n=1 Tax=Cornus florida TaxID=4283 RepID=UPI0028971CC7|nr:non-specific lipid transfer protein GPI-anchored 7-like [Cornus florida]